MRLLLAAPNPSFFLLQPFTVLMRQTRQGRWYVPLSSPFPYMSMLKLGFKRLEQTTMVIFSQSQQALQSKQRLEL
jgi:hypothetical protein